MFFWIMNLLIPFAMILIGIVFLIKHPKINYLFGYRTRMSMKSEETWNYAHENFGKAWLIIGLIFSLFVIVIKKASRMEEDILSLINLGIGLILLIVPIVFIEIALRKHFDKNGIRKNNKE